MADEEPMPHGVIRRITDDSKVEVIDLHSKATTPDSQVYAPEELEYDWVEFLENGWIRCIKDDDLDDENDYDIPSVDYYPPERVNGIYTIEERES